MFVEFKGELTKVWTRTTPNGHAITDFQFKVPTTVKVDRDTGEVRHDSLKGFIFKDMGEEWMMYRGAVKVEGDLRFNRVQKDGQWNCYPELAVKNIYQVKG